MNLEPRYLGGDSFHRLFREIRAEFPKFQIRYRRGWGWKLLHWLMVIATFGRMDRLLTHFVQCIGSKVYVPFSWREWPEEVRIRALTHERKHMRQMRRYGLGWMPLGVVVVGLLYFAVPLPVGLAWFRYRWEREAYWAGAQTMAEEHREEYLMAKAASIAGPAYLYCWPIRSIKAWFRNRLAA
jgi:hypothetical protein